MKVDRGFWIRVCIVTMVALMAGSAIAAQAQLEARQAPATPEVESTHNALRLVRDEIMDGWKRRDIDDVLSHVDPNIVVTWQNGEVNRGPAAIRKFYKEMLDGDQSVLSDIQSTLTVDALSILHGSDTAIAFGSIHDDMTFRHRVTGAAFLGAGKTLALDSRWTATLVRKEGEWKLASYHVSANLFSNPVMDLASKAAGRIGGIAGFVIGAVIALPLAWLSRRRRTGAVTMGAIR